MDSNTGRHFVFTSGLYMIHTYRAYIFSHIMRMAQHQTLSPRSSNHLHLTDSLVLRTQQTPALLFSP